MSIVKIKSKGSDAYVNTDNVLIISPTTTIGAAGVIFIGGVSLEVDGTAKEVAQKFGWQESLEL